MLDGVSLLSTTRASISYYSGTSIPTYTYVTGRSLYSSNSSNGYSYYFYRYDIDEYFDYIYYLRDNCGWTVYTTTTADDSSYATVYMTKGSLLIAIIANFSTTKTVIMFETPTTTVLPTSVTLNASSRTMIVGNMFTLKATVKPTNASNNTVTWSSSNKSVASVSSSGVVTANKAGTATITAKTSNGKTATCSITVKALTLEYYPNTITQIPTFTCITGKSLSNKTVNDGLAMYQYVLDLESHTDYEAYLVNKAGWSVFDETTAEDYSYFMATYEKDDDVVIVMADFASSKTIIAFEETVFVTGISLNKTSTTLDIGESETLTATVAPSNATNKSVTWSSSNTSVATVSSTGKITAKAAGTATITVKTADGSKTATCKVTVTVPVTGVTLNKTSASLAVGKTVTLTATVAPSDATNTSVSWTSSDTSVATVSSAGKITAKASGTATITVKTADGSKTATCEVTVKAKEPEKPAFVVSTVKGTAGGTVSVTLSLKNNPGMLLPRSSWPLTQASSR